MSRSFEPRFLGPALGWAAVTGTATGVFALLLVGGGDLVSQGWWSQLAAAGYGAAYGLAGGLLCAVPVALVVALWVGQDADPDRAGRRAAVSAGLTTVLSVVSLLRLLWPGLLFAWWVSLPILAVAAGLAAVAMRHTARRLARDAEAGLPGRPEGAATGRPGAQAS